MVESTNVQKFVLCEYARCNAKQVRPIKSTDQAKAEHARKNHSNKKMTQWSKESTSSNLHCKACNKCFQKAESHRFSTQCLKPGFTLCDPNQCKFSCLAKTVSGKNRIWQIPYLANTVSGHGINMTVAQCISTLEKSIWYA